MPRRLNGDNYMSIIILQVMHTPTGIRGINDGEVLRAIWQKNLSGSLLVGNNHGYNNQSARFTCNVGEQSCDCSSVHTYI